MTYKSISRLQALELQLMGSLGRVNRRQRNCPRRRRPFTFANIVGPQARILLRWQLIRIGRDTGLRLLEVPLEIRHSPSAARPRAAAFADLTGAPRLMNADEVKNLPLADVKAIADGVVELHSVIIPPIAGQNPTGWGRPTNGMD